MKARAASFQGSGERLTRNEADLVAKALVALEWMMRPAGPEFLMMQLERLSAWATSFNIAHDPRSMPAAYADLAKVPARLLERAVSSAMSATTDTYRLPLPGKLLALIAADLDERKLLRTRLLAMRQAPVDAPKVERGGPQFEAFERQWAEHKAAMARREREDRMSRRGPIEPNHVSNPETDRYARQAWERQAQAPDPAGPPGWQVPTVGEAVAKAAEIDL